MDLTGAKFNEFLKKFSVAVTWEKAMECPCRLAYTGESDPECLVCEGIRFLWEAPQAVNIAVQALHADQQWSRFGEWNKGDILVTIPENSPAYAAGEFDRFTITNAEYRMNTVLTKGIHDRVKQSTITRVDRLIALISGQLQEFVEWDHFIITGPNIAWQPTAGVPDGTQFSIRYVTAPQYFVYGPLVQDRPQFRRNLPKKGVLRLMDLFGQVVN